MSEQDSTQSTTPNWKKPQEPVAPPAQNGEDIKVAPDEQQENKEPKSFEPRSTKPWAPARVLNVPKDFKEAGYRYRWATKNTPGRITKLQSEGWTIVKDPKRFMSAGLPRTINDGTQVDGTVQMRELILMRLPEHLGQERDAYYAKRAGQSAASEEQRQGLYNTKRKK